MTYKYGLTNADYIQNNTKIRLDLIGAIKIRNQHPPNDVVFLQQ